MRLHAGGVEIEVREGTAGDVPLLLSFIRAMAEFEKLPVAATEESLRAALFGDDPAAHMLLAEVDGRPVAYVIYFFTFSTMAGRRCMWLEDIFVDAAFRGKGLGRALMAYLADLAARHQCARLEWSVLDWNEPALRFYKRLGAEILADWRVCRLDESQIAAVASQLPIAPDDSRREG